MSILCPRCGAEYDATLFAFGRRVPCTCGALVERDAPQERRTPLPVGGRRRAGRRAAEDLKRRADAITWTILYTDVAEIDVEIAIEALRDHVREVLPDRLDLFEMVYVARWRRLREQGWGRVI